MLVMIHRYRYSRFAIYKDRNNYDIGAALVRGYKGNGTNSRLSKSGNFILPALQSAFACAMRSREGDTKFHSMNRSPIGAPPNSISTLDVVAWTTASASALRPPSASVRLRDRQLPHRRKQERSRVLRIRGNAIRAPRSSVTCK